MAGNHVAPIYPGNGPAGGVITPPVVAPPADVGGLGQLPGLLLAIRQMEQSRKENQRDREHQLILTDKQLSAGADLRAAQADAARASANHSNAMVDEIKNFSKARGEIFDAEARSARLRADMDTIKMEEFKGDAPARKAITGDLVKQSALNTKTAQANFDASLEGLEAKRSQSFRTAVAATDFALTQAAIDIGQVSQRSLKSAVESVAGESYRMAARRMDMQAEGVDYANKWAADLGDGAGRHLSDTPTVAMVLDPKLRVVDPVRMAGALIFPELRTQGVVTDITADRPSAERVLAHDAQTLSQLEYARFSRGGGDATSQPANDPNKPDGPTYGPEAINYRRFASYRAIEEARETQRAAKPDDTPLGQTYTRLKKELEVRVMNPRQFSPEDYQNALTTLDWLRKQGVTGFAKNVESGASQIFSRLGALPNHDNVELTTRKALKSEFDRQLDLHLSTSTGIDATGVARNTGVLLQLEKSDPERFKAYIASLGYKPGSGMPEPAILKSLRMQREGKGGPGVLKELAEQDPYLAATRKALPDVESKLKTLLDTAYGDWDYSSKGVTPSEKGKRTWESLRKQVDSLVPATEQTSPAAVAPVAGSPEPSTTTAPMSLEQPAAPDVSTLRANAMGSVGLR